MRVSFEAVLIIKKNCYWLKARPYLYDIFGHVNGKQYCEKWWTEVVAIPYGGAWHLAIEGQVVFAKSFLGITHIGLLKTQRWTNVKCGLLNHLSSKNNIRSSIPVYEQDRFQAIPWPHNHWIVSCTECCSVSVGFYVAAKACWSVQLSSGSKSPRLHGEHSPLLYSGN